MIQCRLLAWCAHTLGCFSTGFQKFQQEFDVSGVWFIDNDGSALVPLEIDQSIQ